MNQETYRALILMAVMVCLAVIPAGCASNRQKPSEQLYAGVAVVDITPPLGYPLYWGNTAGELDPLHCRALVFRQGTEQGAVAICELLEVTGDLSQEARRQASEKTSIPIANISIAATHSHTTPNYKEDLAKYIERKSAGTLTEEDKNSYVARLINMVAQTIVEAQAALEPVRLESGTTQQEGVAFNRRYYMKDGHVMFNPGFQNPDIVRPGGDVDPQIGIILIRRAADNHPISCLVNFAMHLDTVGGDKCSADYPYFLEQSLREDLGDKFISIFGTGACGNINHWDVSKPGPQRGHEISTKPIGLKLGEAVKAEIPKLKKISRPALAVRSEIVQVPLQSYTGEDLAWAEHAEELTLTKNPSEVLSERQILFNRCKARRILELAKWRKVSPNLPMEVQVFRLSDDTAIVTLPGEVFVELGLGIKKASPFANTLIIEIANDRPAYVPDRRGFEQGDYEAINSRVAPGGGEMLVDTAVKLLKELKCQ